MPILKRTIQGFSMLEQELQKKAPQPGQQQPNAAPAGGDGQDGQEDPESPGTVGMAA
jgi:hypothetical protein